MCKTVMRKHRMTPKICNTYFQQYDYILSLFENIKTILAIPNFLLCFYYGTGIFFGTSSLLHSELSQKVIWLTTISSLLFSSIVLTASAVNDADKRAKIANIEMLCLLDSHERNLCKISIDILSQKFHGSAFALSAWGFFHFTRGFYLRAIGCLITYSVLIINT